MSGLTLQSKVKLASGHDMPLLGFGGRFTKSRSPADEAERCVKEALNVGYRHIDSAAAYRNEAPCGSAIRSLASTIPRSEVFFTSKVRTKGMSYESAKATVVNTLQETGLDYVDLMLLHAPYGGSAVRKDAWKALVESVEEGKVRSIGISNYGLHHLQELNQHIAELASERGGPGKGGVVSVGQWEIHPWLPRRDIVGWAKENGVAVQAYCPLVRGERWSEEVLQDLSKKHNKTAAQVLVRWSLQKGYIPLPKSVTASRIQENAQVFDFELDEGDMQRLELDEYAPCTWDPTTSALDNGTTKA
ncbi:putative Aldo-keto reductase-like protein [Seiridium cardinale]|uniref:Aldo-keto reductase-like protein n=1 Tax=Seiridium cardinale TaxID=138064 RepID=A0ABR2Y0L3_9PEZI